MITFHLRQSDCARRPCKNENATTFNFASQIAPSICAVMFTKRVKNDATIFKSRCSRTVVCYRLNRVQALPLNFVRFLRLANSSPKLARSPARRSRDGREPADKKSGEMSRVMSAQLPGNGRTVAAAMPPDGRRDDSQDNLPCARFGRAGNLRDDWQLGRATACKQLLGMSPSAFNHDI